MPHKIGQARIAVLREAEEDSGVVARNLAGTTGVLEVWESDHKFPGRQGAVFYYPLTFDHEGNGSTARFFRTAYNYRLTDDGKTAIFDKGGRSGTNRFVLISRAALRTRKQRPKAHMLPRIPARRLPSMSKNPGTASTCICSGDKEELLAGAFFLAPSSLRLHEVEEGKGRAPIDDASDSTLRIVHEPHAALPVEGVYCPLHAALVLSRRPRGKRLLP